MSSVGSDCIQRIIVCGNRILYNVTTIGWKITAILEKGVLGYKGQNGCTLEKKSISGWKF